jgi:membrane-bound serine protease (ClpP class)
MAIIESPLFANLLYLSLMAGLWFAALAIVSPGTGVLELIALVLLAGAGLGTVVLPLNWWALVLLLIGVVFFVLSLQRKGSETWLAASALVLSAGSVFLFRVEDSFMAVHPLLALVVSALTLGFFWFAIRKVIVAQHAVPSIDPGRVLNQEAEVRTALNPTGSVYAMGELWTARSEKPLKPGTMVIVTGREGLVLTVEPLE